MALAVENNDKIKSFIFDSYISMGFKSPYDNYLTQVKQTTKNQVSLAFLSLGNKIEVPKFFSVEEKIYCPETNKTLDIIVRTYETDLTLSKEFKVVNGFVFEVFDIKVKDYDLIKKEEKDLPFWKIALINLTITNKNFYLLKDQISQQILLKEFIIFKENWNPSSKETNFKLNEYFDFFLQENKKVLQNQTKVA